MTTLITLGHGRSRNGAWDPGAHGNGTTEADWLRGAFLASLKKYAKGHAIDFYEQNMFGNRDADTIKKYDDVVELHLDAASAAAKGGHVIIYKGYKPDALDNRLGATIQKHFGLRGGKMFDGRDNLYNLNVFTKRKISYRLLELGFITNKANMDYFKKNYDEVAKNLVEDILHKKITYAPAKPSPEVTPSSMEGVKPMPKEYRAVSASHKDAWEWAKKKGYLNGEKPGEPLTREQFATVLKRVLENGK